MIWAPSCSFRTLELGQVPARSVLMLSVLVPHSEPSRRTDAENELCYNMHQGPVGLQDSTVRPGCCKSKAVSALGHSEGRLLWDTMVPLCHWTWDSVAVFKQAHGGETILFHSQVQPGLTSSKKFSLTLCYSNWSSDPGVHLKCRVSGLTHNPPNHSLYFSRTPCMHLYARESLRSTCVFHVY